MHEFEEKTNSRLLEICTSDTHVTAARALGAKGYLALGDSTSSDELAALIIALYEKANSRLRDASFSSFFVDSTVKTAGEELLDEFSGLLDSTINVAKKGAVLLAFLGIIVVILVVLL